MTMYKHVDGVEVEMTPEEVDAFLAEQEEITTPLVSYVVLVEDVWMRMEDAEAEEFDAVMAVSGGTAPIRIRRAFNLAVTLTVGTELYNYVLSTLTDIAGEDRAAVILSTSQAVTPAE